MDGSKPKPRSNAWSPEMADRVQVLWKQGVTAGDIAKELNTQFGCAVSRSSVLGHMHRERTKNSILRPPKQVTKKSDWRKDDELWTNALFMRKVGHSWKPLALAMRSSISSLKERLRAIAKDDMAEDGTPAEEWAHVLED